MRGYRGAILLLTLAPLAGCLVKGRLDPSGGARFTVNVRLVSVAHFEQIKMGLQAPSVTLESASMTPRKVATFEIACSDVRQLGSAPALSSTAVTLSDGDRSERTLTVSLANPRPQEWTEALQRYLGGTLAISVDLPGDVIRSDATATSGRTVSWTWPLADVSPRPRIDLAATFKAEN